MADYFQVWQLLYNCAGNDLPQILQASATTSLVNEMTFVEDVKTDEAWALCSQIQPGNPVPAGPKLANGGWRMAFRSLEPIPLILVLFHLLPPLTLWTESVAVDGHSISLRLRDRFAGK